jgi:hypothetical protein
VVCSYLRGGYLSEIVVRNLILRTVGRKPAVRLFSNPVGIAYVGNRGQQPPGTRQIRFGLHVGSSDLIGWVTREITNDMVGERVAQFLALEVKSPTGKVRPEQLNFIEVVKRAGGVAAIVRSVEDAEKAIKGEQS